MKKHPDSYFVPGSQRMLAFCASSLLLLQTAGAVNVLTQHNDQFRTGANTNETILTTANVNSTQFGKLYSYKVDGYVFAQPLYMQGISIGGGTHNVLFVASMEDSVYAFDADSNTTYWHVNFTGGSITPVPITDITGNNLLNIHNHVGILSTPVIDPSTGTIYVLARTKDTSNSTYQQKLHALNISTGAEKFGGPVNIAPSGFDTKMQNQRPGLVLANGNIYICWGSHEDITPYHGWVMSFNAANLSQQVVFNTTPGGAQSAVWMSGQAPAFDSSGNLYLITGNGDWDGSTKWGETFLKMTPSLTVSDWFTPTNEAFLNSIDNDFGSGGALLLPGASGYPSTSDVIGGGKIGIMYVLSKTAGLMGHMQNNDAGAVQFWKASSGGCSSEIHGSPVYWNSSSQGQMIYLWGTDDVGRCYKFNGTTFTTTPFTKTTAASPTSGCGYPGAFLSLSANGAANGIVWANCLFSGDADHDIVPGILRAYDANNLGTELWDSRQNQARDDIGLFAKDVPPTIANGKVYMSSFNSNICVYGLLSTNTTIANGVYKIINRNSGLALDAKGQNTTNGTPVQQFTYNAGANQQWGVTNIGSGQYVITGVQSHRVAEVTGQSLVNGALIELFDNNGGANQKWVITPTSGGYNTLQGVQSGLLMEVFGSALTNSASVDQWSSTGGNNQQWSFQAP